MTSESPGKIWVFDSSPLIHLDQLGYLAHLPALIGRALVPPAVHAELSQGRGRPGTNAPDQPWLEVRAPHPERIAAVQSDFAAGAGETEALALALELGGRLVIDERRARRYASQKGLIHAGVLAILSAIHARGLAARSPAEDLELLETSGMYLSGALKADLLAQLSAKEDSDAPGWV